MTVVKIIYYLNGMPNFLKEINEVGSIPVTVFLENLLIKTTMTKLSITREFRTWVINLILKFKETLPGLETDNIKELRSSKSYQLIEDCGEDVAIDFAIKDLSGNVRKREVGLVSVLVHFLRVTILSAEMRRKMSGVKGEERWRELI